MQEEMINGEHPAFDKMPTEIKFFVEKVKDSNWKMDLEFSFK